MPEFRGEASAAGITWGSVALNGFQSIKLIKEVNVAREGSPELYSNVGSGKIKISSEEN